MLDFKEVEIRGGFFEAHSAEEIMTFYEKVIYSLERNTG